MNLTIAAAAVLTAAIVVVTYVINDKSRKASLAQLREAQTKLVCLKAASQQANYRALRGLASQEEADNALKAWLSQLYDVQALEKKLGL